MILLRKKYCWPWRIEKLIMDKEKDITEEKLAAIYESMCETILSTLKNELEHHGISKEQYDSARKFVEIDPNTPVARKLIEFQVSDEIKAGIVDN